MENNFTAESAARALGFELGARYLNGYWRRVHVIEAAGWVMNGSAPTPWVRSRWADGHSTVHSTPFEHRAGVRDQLLSATPADDDLRTAYEQSPLCQSTRLSFERALNVPGMRAALSGLLACRRRHQTQSRQLGLGF